MKASTFLGVAKVRLATSIGDERESGVLLQNLSIYPRLTCPNTPNFDDSCNVIEKREHGECRRMKKRSKHTIVGIAGAFALSILSWKVGEIVLKSLGHTGTMPVKIIGGGSSETVIMSKAGYWAGVYIQTPVLALSILALTFYVEGIDNEQTADAENPQ